MLERGQAKYLNENEDCWYTHIVTSVSVYIRFQYPKIDDFSIQGQGNSVSKDVTSASMGSTKYVIKGCYNVLAALFLTLCGESCL